MSHSIFSQIIDREIPAFILAEDEKHLAFLDINPVAQGHTLIVPKRWVDDFFDLTPKELAHIMLFAQRVARGIQKACTPLRVSLKVHGLEIPHAHIHLIPLYAKKKEAEPMEVVQEKIIEAIEPLS